MRNYISIFTLIVAVAVSACSDRFLYEAPQLVEISPDTIFISNEQFVDSTITISIASDINAAYTVFQFPQFFTIDTINGRLIKGETSITYHTTQTIENYYSNNQLNGQLIINVEGYGLVAYQVQIRLPKENPVLHQIEFSSLDINIGEADSTVLRVTNKTGSVAYWSLYEKPDWLVTENVSGSIENGQSLSLLFKVNRDYKNAGIYKGNIVIYFNSAYSFQQTISVSMDVVNVLDNPSKYNLQLIEGSVIAAEFLSEKNELLILTTSPNRLTSINFDTKTPKVIELTKVPTCMAVAENGQEVIIGYTLAQLSLINLQELKISKTLELPFAPFDVALGENGWCYVSSRDDIAGGNFASIDMDSGRSVYNHVFYTVRGMTLLKKIPYRKQIMGIPANSFPSVPMVADISNDSISADFKSYFFGEYDTNGELWFLKNGAFGIAKNGRIYKYNFELPFEEQIVYYGNLGLLNELNHASENRFINKAALSFNINSLQNEGCFVILLELNELYKTGRVFPTPVVGFTLTIGYAFFDYSGENLLMLINRKQNYVDNQSQWHIETRAL